MFEGIPGPLQVAFYTVIPVLLVWGAFAFAERVRNWERGGPDRRRTTPKTSSAASPTSAPACTCARCCATRPPG